MQGFLDLVSDFSLNVKVVEKHWKEFCVEGEEEDAIIKFIFQKCHSGFSVQNRLIGNQRKHYFLFVNQQHLLSTHSKLWYLDKTRAHREKQGSFSKEVRIFVSLLTWRNLRLFIVWNTLVLSVKAKHSLNLFVTCHVVSGRYTHWLLRLWGPLAMSYFIIPSSTLLNMPFL